MDTKRCSKCKAEKPITEFHKNRSEPDGLCYWCKECMCGNTHRYYRDHSDERIEYSRNYRKDKKKLVYEYNKSYMEKHKEYVKGYLHDWHFRNRERQLEIGRQWARDNPESVAVARHKRRARRIINGGVYTVAQWKSLVSFYCPDGKCLSCGEKRKLTVDHVIPIIKKGKNSVSNLQPICHSCNSKKYIDIIDYRPDGGMYAKWIQENVE